MSDIVGQPAEPQPVDSQVTPDVVTPENPATSTDVPTVPESPAHPVPDEDPEEHMGDVLKDPWTSGNQEWAPVQDDHEDSETFRNAYEAEVREPSQDQPSEETK